MRGRMGIGVSWEKCAGTTCMWVAREVKDGFNSETYGNDERESGLADGVNEWYEEWGMRPGYKVKWIWHGYAWPCHGHARTWWKGSDGCMNNGEHEEVWDRWTGLDGGWWISNGEMGMKEFEEREKVVMWNGFDRWEYKVGMRMGMNGLVGTRQMG